MGGATSDLTPPPPDTPGAETLLLVGVVPGPFVPEGGDETTSSVESSGTGARVIPSLPALVAPPPFPPTTTRLSSCEVEERLSNSKDSMVAWRRREGFLPFFSGELMRGQSCRRDSSELRVILKLQRQRRKI